MRYPLSQVSLTVLNTCHPFIVQSALKVTEVMDFRVECGSRTMEEQDRLKAQGLTTLSGHSPYAKHVVGAYRKLSDAIDVDPYYQTEPHVRYPDLMLKQVLDPANSKAISRQKYIEGCKAYAQYARLADAFIHAARRIADTNPEWFGWRLRWGGDWDEDYRLSDNIFDDLPHLEIMRP
jgi:hypothetical protein